MAQSDKGDKDRKDRQRYRKDRFNKNYIDLTTEHNVLQALMKSKKNFSGCNTNT